MIQILLFALLLAPAEGAGGRAFERAVKQVCEMEFISVKEVWQLRKKIKQRFAGRSVPYSLVGNIIGKVSHGHVNNLLRNWYFIPAEDREKIVCMFEQAGLGHLVFLSLYESGAQVNDRSGAGAIGLFQIMPRTAELHCGIDLREELYDPVVNAACAIEILKDKGVMENLAYGLVLYNGKLKSCPARDYFACLQEKLATETDEKKKRQYLGSLMYVPNVMLHQAIGEELILGRDAALR